MRGVFFKCDYCDKTYLDEAGEFDINNPSSFPPQWRLVLVEPASAGSDPFFPMRSARHMCESCSKFKAV